MAIGAIILAVNPLIRDTNIYRSLMSLLRHVYINFSCLEMVASKHD